MKKNVFKEIPCPVCGKELFETILEFSPNEFLNDLRKRYYNLEVLKIDMNTKFYIKKCRNCSFNFVNPRFQDELYKIVNNESKVVQNSVKAWKDDIGTDLACLYNTYHKWLVAPTFLRSISYLKKRFCKAKNEKFNQIRLLDYGCGSGHVLELCEPFGIQAKGIDIDEWRLKQCKEKGLKVCKPEDLNENEKFDVIISTSVVEHVFDLNEYFSFISKHLENGGICSLVGLNSQIIDLEKKSGKFQIVMPLEHLYYFTKKSFDLLIKKHHLKRIKFANNFQEICKPIDYIKPLVKNLIFQGFFPSGSMEVDLIKL